MRHARTQVSISNTAYRAPSARRPVRTQLLRSALSLAVAVLLLAACGRRTDPSDIILPVHRTNPGDMTLGRTLTARGDHGYPPFEFIDETGAPNGFNVEILTRIAEVMHLDIRIDLGPWHEVRREMSQGSIDLLAGVYRTEERDRHMDFSIPHFYASYAVFVHEASQVRRLEDLTEARIIVQTGDLAHDYLAERGIGTELVTKREWDQVLPALAAQEADCAVLNMGQGMRYLRANNLRGIRMVGKPVFQRPYCVGVREGDAWLLAAINEGLNILKSSGEYDAIYQRWFGVFDRHGPLSYGWVRVLIVAFAALFAILLLGVAWFRVLRRQVASQTAALSRELSHREAVQAQLETALAEVVSAKDEAQRAQQQAEEANDAKSRFLANVSHELRTPLHGIMGMGNLLARTPLSDHQSKVLGMLETSAAQLFRVLSDLLDVTRIASGKLSIRPAEFSLAEFVEWLEPILRSLVEEQGLTFLFAASGTERILRADRERIAQIILNLTGNAAQYTEHGSVSVNIRCTEALEIQVADSGKGIPVSEQERIFAPFAQYQAGDGLRTHKAGHGPGLGLGLAIVRSLTDLLGGTIHLDSEPDRGTTFRIEIPVQTAALKRHLSAERGAASHAARTGPKRRDGRTLIVEDQAINRLYLAKLFQPHGWQIHECESGEEAVRLMKRHRYDVVFMDVGLTDMDGREATRAVRAWEQDTGAARTPIVALTAHAYQEDRDRCAAAGMDGFLAKPFDEAGLWGEVNRLCPADEAKGFAGSRGAKPDAP